MKRGNCVLFMDHSLFLRPEDATEHVKYRQSLITASAGILLLLSAFDTNAQESEPKRLAGYGVEVGYVGGTVFKHSPKFRAPIPDYSQAIDISILRQTCGKSDWEERRHYPVIGLGLTYTDYGIDSVYGKCIGAYPVLQIPIVGGKKLEWTFKLGLGVGYVTQSYERIPTWDTINNAVGGHLNNFTMFATDIRYKVNDQWAVSVGGNFSHISDGSWRIPNLGVNMYGAHLAVRYFPVTSRPDKRKCELENLKNRWLIQARLGFSANEHNAADGPLLPIYAGSVFASKRYAGRNKAFAGLDYSYHKGVEYFLKNNEIFPGQEAAHSWKSAAFIGNEFLMGRFGLVLQLGFYLKQAELVYPKYYQKLGYNFYLIKKEKGPVKELCIYSMLKTHRSQAEFIEFGMGVGL